jgi:hypothetical protein
MPSGRLSEGEVVDFLKVAIGNPASVGDNLLVAAPGLGFKLVVYGYQLNATGGANNVVFRSGTTPISSVKSLANQAGSNVPPNTLLLFECLENQVLNTNLSAATAVGVDLQYAIARV